MSLNIYDRLQERRPEIIAIAAKHGAYNVIFSSSLGRIKGTPSSLGSAMILLGLFYILSILLIPAYLNSQKISFLSYSPPG